MTDIHWRELSTTEGLETRAATTPRGVGYWACYIEALDSWRLSVFDGPGDAHPRSQWRRTLDGVKAAVQKMEGERGS